MKKEEVKAKQKIYFCPCCSKRITKRDYSCSYCNVVINRKFFSDKWFGRNYFNLNCLSVLISYFFFFFLNLIAFTIHFARYRFKPLPHAFKVISLDIKIDHKKKKEGRFELGGMHPTNIYNVYTPTDFFTAQVKKFFPFSQISTKRGNPTRPY